MQRRSRVQRPLARSFATLVLLSLLSIGTAVHAQPASEVDPKARTLFEAGREAYDRGRFTEALALYEQAYALSPRSKMLFNIGRAAEADGNNTRAIEAYSGYLQQNPQAENREFVEGRLTRLRAASPAAAVTAPLAPALGSVPATAPATAGPNSVATQPGSPPRELQQSAAPPAVLVQNPTYYGPGAPPPAAVPRRHVFRLYTGLRLGTGGTASWDAETDYGTTWTDIASEDMSVTPGLQFGAGWVWRVFGIGAELRLNWAKFDPAANGEATRNLLLDVVLKPRVGYKFKSIPLDLYAAIPIGVSAPLFDDYDDDETLDISYGAGLSLGFLVGATYFFGEHWGVNVETGGQLTLLSADYRAYEEDLSFHIGEFSALAVNAVFAL